MGLTGRLLPWPGRVRQWFAPGQAADRYPLPAGTNGGGARLRLFTGHAPGHRECMLGNAVKGAIAGLAGTTALNAATYADMAWRGRAASRAPEQAVEELAKRAGRDVPGEGEAGQNRLQGLAALAGIATGMLIGAAAGQLRGVIRGLGPVLGPVLVGGAAMAVTDFGMYRLGVSDPRSWDAGSWLSDAAPHYAYGVVTWVLLSG